MTAQAVSIITFSGEGARLPAEKFSNLRKQNAGSRRREEGMRAFQGKSRWRIG